MVGICGMGLRFKMISLIVELRLKMFDDFQVHCPAFSCLLVVFFCLQFFFLHYIGYTIFCRKKKKKKLCFKSPFFSVHLTLL